MRTIAVPLPDSYLDRVPAGRAVGQRIRRLRRLELARTIRRPNDDGVTADCRVPLQLPEPPGEGSERLFQRGRAPGLAAVDADLDLADSLVAAESDAAELDRSRLDSAALLGRRVDARH